MRWFGERWAALVCFEEEHQDTPTNSRCDYCTSPIKQNDRGIVVPTNWTRNRAERLVYHLGCFVEMLGADKETLRELS